MKLIFIPVLIGLFAGVIAGLCGVGGGIIMVPAFVYLLDMDQKHAIATSMAVIAPTAAMAIFRFSGAGLVRWDIFIPTAIGSVIAAIFAVSWAKEMSNQTLTRVFAVVMIVIGVSMLFKKV